MSWDATLLDADGEGVHDWNFTHNCNGMANAALDPHYEQRSVADEVFRFNGSEATGCDGNPTS